jgi:RHS repeat-associated protein
LGSTRAVTDAQGNAHSNNGAGGTRHDYLPFGEEIQGGASLRTVIQGYVSAGVRQKFTGYEHDPETGLDYAQARYYASAQGRFTSVDPLMASARSSNPQTWNRYVYTLNNPVRLVDPSGTASEPAPAQQQPPPPPRVVVVVFYGGSVSGGSRVSGGTDNSNGTHQVRPGEDPAGLGENVLDTEANDIAQQIANCFPQAQVMLGGPTGINQISNDLIQNKPDHVLIYGFSMGANTAVALTNLLTKNGVTVDQLTTVDPAGVNLKNLTDRPHGMSEDAGSMVWASLKISNPKMVGDALNYSGTLYNTVGGATNETITQSMRRNISTPFVHTSMDDITSPQVVQRIGNRLHEIYTRPRR